MNNNNALFRDGITLSIHRTLISDSKNELVDHLALGTFLRTSALITHGRPVEEDGKLPVRRNHGKLLWAEGRNFLRPADLTNINMQGAKTTSLTAQRHSRITVPVNSQRVNDARRCMAVRAFATGFDHKVQGAFCAGGLALLVAMTPAMGARAEVRLPPLDNDPQRCERGYVRAEYFPTE